MVAKAPRWLVEVGAVREWVLRVECELNGGNGGGCGSRVHEQRLALTFIGGMLKEEGMGAGREAGQLGQAPGSGPGLAGGARAQRWPRARVAERTSGCGVLADRSDSDDAGGSRGRGACSFGKQRSGGADVEQARVRHDGLRCAL